MKIIYFLLICALTSCKDQDTNYKKGANQSKDPNTTTQQNETDKIHYFSTTNEEYDYIVNPKGLLNYIRGISKIKTNYTLESVGIDGYTIDKDIDLSYLMRWEDKKVLPCAFVIAFLEKGKVSNLKCIPIDNINEDLATKTKNDFKEIDIKWLPNLIHLLLNLSNQYAIKVNFY